MQWNAGEDSGYTSFSDDTLKTLQPFFQDFQQGQPMPPPPSEPYNVSTGYYYPMYDFQGGRYRQAAFNNSNLQWPYPDYGQGGAYPIDDLRLLQIEALLAPQTSPSVGANGLVLQAGDNRITGLGFEPWGIDILITSKGFTDNWYGLNDTAKFGWVCSMYDGQWMSEMRWVNFTNQRIVLPKEGLG